MRRRFLFLAALWLFPAPCFAAACSLTTLTVGPPKIVVCTDTTATTVTIPADWPHAGTGATIEAIGGGGGGGWSSGGGGSGGCGGAYSQTGSITNANALFTAGDSVSVQVGAGGAISTSTSLIGGAGTDSFIKDVGSTTRVLAKGGGGGPANFTACAGGASGSGTGDVKNSGGAGGAGSGVVAPGGGGGAGGPHGNGAAGGTAGFSNGAAGGGGNGGGGIGQTTNTSVGGAGAGSR